MSYNKPNPILNTKELQEYNALSTRYEKLVEPSKVAKLAQKTGDLLPEKIKEIANNAGDALIENELYKKVMEFAGSGFKTLEEIGAKYSISQKDILAKYNKNYELDLISLEEICTLRSYDVAKVCHSVKDKNILMATIEGAGTGALGFKGLPLNIALSMFLYFRAVQLIAMIYGYDVKNSAAEMEIAGQVFVESLSPKKHDINNEPVTIVGKIMVMGQVAVLKDIKAKGWQGMAEFGGIPLLLAQLRAMANKAAKNAIDKAGRKGIEHTVFDGALKQIGKKLTQDTVKKSLPYFSAILGGLIDTAQMKNVIEYADIFYQRRFIIEKEERVNMLFVDDESSRDEDNTESQIIDVEECDIKSED